MLRRDIRILLFISILAGLGVGLSWGLRRDAESGHSVAKPEKRWRVGYYDGGAYMEYPLNLHALARGLMELGYLEHIDLPSVDSATSTRVIWDCLCQANSASIEFVSDAFWSADWDGAIRERNQRECLNRLVRTGDIDFMLAMGTWAGQDLATEAHSVPTMVMSCSDPVGAGIVRDPRYSGLPHVHAKSDPSRYIRQVRAFHNLTGFKRLGVVYEDSFEGPIYSNLAELNLVVGGAGVRSRGHGGQGAWLVRGGMHEGSDLLLSMAGPPGRCVLGVPESGGRSQVYAESAATASGCGNSHLVPAGHDACSPGSLDEHQ
jgi:hypothetical protein